MEYEPWAPQAPALDMARLPEILAQSPVVILHCWAIWDMHDRRVDKSLEEIGPEFPQIAFFSVDFDDERNSEFLREPMLLNIPALICFIRGARHETWIGARPPDMMRVKFTEWLALAYSEQSIVKKP